jgi:signal transduction histidine kinase/ActR/RegA family two-component response regulator/HAMP domain-containing protein
MKLKGYFKKSLSTKYASLMGISIGFFLIGTAILWLSLHYVKETYSNEIELLEEKQDLTQDIVKSFNSAFSDARGYFAYGNPALKENALLQSEKVKGLELEFTDIASTMADQQFLNDAKLFYSFYFEETLPNALAFYEEGNLDEVAQLANTDTTGKIKAFQSNSENYMAELDEKLENSFKRLIRLQSYVQIAFTLFILIILVTILRITRIMFRNVGKPLGQLAMAANDLADGQDIPINQLDTEREDELGSLSIAFKKMVETVKEKELHLVSQNEELLAQQEELHAQQTELEETLEILRNNELKLQKRNEMINKISNSLEKQEVIDSIVVNMCSIIDADCGMLVLLNEETYATYGVSEAGAKQFRDNLNSGLNQRLSRDKQPFMIKRELSNTEKGYHEMTTYSYDLYLPILSSSDELVAILVFSRFGDHFPQNDMDEYTALTKNIAISLERIRIYEKSEEARRLNQDILNTVQEGIQLVNDRGEIIQVNKQLTDLFDWKDDIRSLVGMSWKEWTSLLDNQIEEAGQLYAFLENSIQTKCTEILSEDTFIYKKLNPSQVIKVYCEGLYHGDEKVGTVFVYRDITKEFEVDQMKSEFVSTVSHELRTPLASILGFTELILNRELKPEKQKKYLSTIYNEAKRLTALINDFLDVQRMESGKQSYEKKFISLKPVLEKVIETQKVNTDIHQFKLIDHSDGGLILGDRDKMEQVFTNLVNNAIKYSPEGGLIELQLHKDDNYLHVDVKDEGLGIPTQSMEKLFSKFYRIDNSDRRRIGGTGLGLAIVQEIVKAHGGEVQVHSTYGQGSTFTCSFPLVPAQVETISHNGSKGIGYKVMVVEDDQSLGQLISTELKENQFQVSYFKRGQDALLALSKETPDAIVLDILLEEDDMDGWGIMKMLKEDETLSNIPIFVSTALDEKEKGYSLGATDYLVKPYKPSQLSKTIMQTLLKIGKIGQVFIPQEDLADE